MRRFVTTILLAAAVLCCGRALSAGGNKAGYRPFRYTQYDRAARWHNANRSWHNNYYRTDWGHPVAVIVPPIVNWQTNYGWGAGRNRVTPINHQFGRPYVDPVTGTAVYPAPVWPADTDQMGSYYVRGPW